ncbi:O-antigen/teichoic acid export membrane protein [Flavobacterium endophyticum]|uniref:O-antigen/teichoic acid export membrane protein n=1 Tax=Flavobacterium endophyticum TaxID=1540163 RepID=A0A495M779_9FLAO|nr:lipopolysaccharide biosynthesis protein [Flavobacterium endophyticum]RKS21841.1 O-antigen/teichoic acid export membrane protein [Flavobacterium endophyticum]
MSLKNTVMSGMFWTFFDNFILKGLSFLTTIVLAKILTPADFGLIGSISIFIAISTTLVDGGLTSSLIRSNNLDKDDYSTVFYTNIVTSIIIYLILFLSASSIATFFNQKIIEDILKVYGLVFVISSLSSVQTTILIKELNFKKLAVLNIPSVVVGSVTALIMGYNGYGVWSLVFMYLVVQVVSALFLWSFSKWRPNLSFSFPKFKTHINYGYKLLITGILGNIFNNIYGVVIGRYFPIKVLGYYDRANTFSQYPATVLILMIGKVSFPVLAKYQDDITAFTLNFKKFISYSLYLTAPVMITISFYSKLFFVQFLGGEWRVAVPYFIILCYAAIFLPLHSLNTNALKIFGRTDMVLKLEIIMKVLISITLLIGFQFGIIGIVYSALVNSILLMGLNMYFVGLIIPYSFFEQFKSIIKIALLSAVLVLVFYGTTFIYPEIEFSIIYLSIFACFNFCLYIFLSKILNFEEAIFLFDIINKGIVFFKNKIT